MLQYVLNLDKTHTRKHARTYNKYTHIPLKPIQLNTFECDIKTPDIIPVACASAAPTHGSLDAAGDRSVR